MRKGSCLFGAVTLEVAGDLPGPGACHRAMCRKQFGHVFAATGVPRATVTIRGEERVTWYQSSEKARRGFCATCGSSLCWDAIHKDRIALAMGALDTPTGTKLSKHIFVADKGDCYDIADGLPQNPR